MKNYNHVYYFLFLGSLQGSIHGSGKSNHCNYVKLCLAGITVIKTIIKNVSIKSDVYFSFLLVKSHHVWPNAVNYRKLDKKLIC